MGAVLTALVLVVLASGPSLDRLVCRDEITAPDATVSVHVQAANHDLAAGEVHDDSAPAGACHHGHCHHVSPFAPQFIEVATVERSTPNRHALVDDRWAAARAPFTQERPPRA